MDNRASALPCLRKAEAADAPALSCLMEQTYRDTFAAMNTAADMALHCRAFYSPALQAREILDDAIDTVVCEFDGQLIGFAQLREAPCPAPVNAMRACELQRLYVARPWHGQGVARAIMQRMLAVAQTYAADLLWLGVWEHNARAIAFYEKCGFMQAGSHVFLMGTDPQRDLVMIRWLRDA